MVSCTIYVNYFIRGSHADSLIGFRLPWQMWKPLQCTSPSWCHFKGGKWRFLNINDWMLFSLICVSWSLLTSSSLKSAGIIPSESWCWGYSSGPTITGMGSGVYINWPGSPLFLASTAVADALQWIQNCSTTWTILYCSSILWRGEASKWTLSVSWGSPSSHQNCKLLSFPRNWGK